MSDLHCVELGFSQLKNLCRLTTSLVIPSKTPDDALSYVQTHCPQALCKSQVHRIYRVQHVMIDWAQGTCEIVEETV
jgi:hypothetical protein